MKALQSQQIDPPMPDQAYVEFYAANQISPPSTLFNELNDTYYFAKNKQGQFIYANKLLSERFQLSSAESVFNKTDFDFFRLDIAEQIRKDDVWVMKSGQPIRKKLEIVNDKDQQTLWLITTKSPLYNIHGEVVGIEGLSIDASKTQTQLEPYHVFKDCIDYIQKNYMHHIKMNDLASISNMSLSTFERQFKRHLGSTPVHYIKKVRIQEACGLLLRGLGIPEVAHACGFCDQSYFGKEFKRLMATTPKQYMKNKQHLVDG